MLKLVSGGKNYIKYIYSVLESASMALGEVLGEACGKIVGTYYEKFITEI
ncbi:MAG: hypothetical protein ACJ71D_08710 [Nitrososphaera sp.]